MSVVFSSLVYYPCDGKPKGMRPSGESLTRNALTRVNDRDLNVLLDLALCRGSFDSFKTLNSFKIRTYQTGVFCFRS